MTREEVSCEHMSYRRDCDGDYDRYCYKTGDCPYKKRVRDVDGDWIALCRK